MMRIAVVTGASSGMGKEFVKQIDRRYKDLDEIWVIARREKRLMELAKSCKNSLRIISGDLENEQFYDNLKILLDEHKPDIRMLVNSAGFGKTGYVDEISMENQKIQARMVEVNCVALTKMICLCLPFMTKGSRIVNLASAAAFCPQTGFSVYAATKAYVLSFSRSLAQELRKRNIYVTVVCPGPVQTEFFEVAGQATSLIKRLVMAKPELVVKKAMKDAIKGEEVSIYGISMRASYVASKILPHKIIIEMMDKIQ